MVGRSSSCILLLLVWVAACPEAVHLLSDSFRALDLPGDAGPGSTETVEDDMKGTLWDGLDENATKAKIAEIWGNLSSGKEPKSAIELPDKPSPKKYSNSEMVVQWDSTDAETGSNVSFFWDHACEGKTLTGDCTFKKTDKNNPPGLHVSLLQALDGKARVTVSAAVNVMGITRTFSAECSACDDACVIKMESAGTATITLPACPLSETFDLILPEMDFSKIPSFIRGYSESSVELTRGTGARVFKASINAWV
mmetsp:Transcript_89645/g.208817  ORF Transcript_89645/g.208817 Transcript_89645/m.208817 type:complete len:253 (+) Transcript_89645:52-810(+)